MGAAGSAEVVPRRTAASGTAARWAVESAYRRFWLVAATVDSRPEPVWRAALASVAADPLLTQIYEGLRQMRSAGERQFGTVVVHPMAIEIQGERASVIDCQDASAAGNLDVDTGLPTTVGSAHTSVAAALVLGADGRWRVFQARYLDGTC